MLIFPAANNLLLMFVALEVLSLPLYLMCGLARRRRLLSQEAAVKYFLLGAFASAFFLYGLALLYGYAGSVELCRHRAAAAPAPTQSDVAAATPGSALLLVGLLFKAGVAPFHSWTPDVYQGAPTPVTAFMAACTKVAAFGAHPAGALRRRSADDRGTGAPILWAVAIASMVVGAILGLTQTDVKRILAYSSIAHAGLHPGRRGGARPSTASPRALFYLLTYGFTTLARVRRDHPGARRRRRGHPPVAVVRAGARVPVVAARDDDPAAVVAGIPLTSGFIGKFVVFRPRSHDGMAPLVVIALVASADRGVLLPAHRRADVLRRAAGERPDRSAMPGLRSTTVALTVGVARHRRARASFPQPVLGPGRQAPARS